MIARRVFLLGLFLLTGRVFASEIYVDNSIGRDGDDGLTA